MATQNISATIGLAGEDGASVEINKAKHALHELNREAEGGGESAEKLGERLTEAGEKTEHLGHGVARLTRSMKSFAGESAGALGEMTHGLHGVTAIMQLLPGPIGIVGGAIAAAGLGFVAWRNSLKEAAVEAATEAGKERERHKSDKEWLAERYGFSRDLLKLKQDEVDYTQKAMSLAGELVEIDNKIDKARAEGHDKEVHALIAEKIELFEQRDTLEELNKAQQERIKLEKEQQAILKAGTDLQHQQWKNFEAQADLVLDKRERLARKSLVLDNEANDIEQKRKIARLQYEEHELDIVQLKLREAQLDGEALDIDKKRMALAKEGERHHAAQKAHFEWRLKATENDIKDAEALAKIQEEARKHMAQEAANAADDPSVKAAFLRAEVEAETAAKIREIKDKTFGTDKQRADATKAIELDAAATKHRIADQEEKDLKALAEKKKKDADDDKKRLLDEEKRLQDRNISAVNSAKDMLDKLGMGKREDAAIDAAVAAYKAYGAIATGDGWAAANFTMEAIGAAAVAAGAGGGGSGGGVSAPSGGGSPAAPSTRATVGSAPGGGPTNTTIILQGGAYVGSMQGVGKALQVAVGSLKNTGITPAMGV